MTLEEMKRIKQERGFTMAQLSAYSGVPLGTLQKIFTGETVNPRYATRQALEKALKAEQPDRDDCNSINSGVVRESVPFYQAQHTQQEKQQGEYTLEDYYTMPDERRVELIDGVIYDMSAPNFVHQRVVGELFAQVNAYIRQEGGACIPAASPVDVRLDCDDRTMIQPDLIIVCSRDKIKRWGIMGAPEFVLEVVSQSSRKKDYTKKLQKYADAGVKEYWIIDPDKGMLLTYDFIHEELPCVQPLQGQAGLALYDGKLQIDLDEITALIQEWPE